MEKDYTTWKLLAGFLLILLFMILSSSASGQTYTCDEDICVVEFNASWNAKNNVEWLERCNYLKKSLPTVLPSFEKNPINSYFFIDCLNKHSKSMARHECTMKPRNAVYDDKGYIKYYR